ncbi:MAG: type III-B CRISPR module RAMP protein Cmr4 [Chloroflexi bacterium]|nr:type III-B CRISPR module RAMP protein Cmr4 [Chloroflexota bacterium]
MFKSSALLYLYVETPFHPGSGSGLGVVDLPVQRERITGYPMMQASGLKGKLRAEAMARATTDAEKEQVLAVFGPETNGAAEHAGAFSPGDARILLFPVRSLLGVFAWTTSRTALARFQRDLQTAASLNPKLAGGFEKFKTQFALLPGDLKEDEAFVATGNDVSADNQVTLEEFTFTARLLDAVKELGKWFAGNAFPFVDENDEYKFWRGKAATSLVVLPDNAFRDFTEYATEVINRIKLKRETKTVESGALWSEEHLPSDTVLYAPLFASRARRAGCENLDVLGFVKTLCNAVPRVQLGGDETVGRGLVRLRYNGGNDANPSTNA